MNMLPQFSPEIRDLVVALPFRVGYFISQSDQSGGDAADDAEEAALRNIVTFYVEDTVKSEFAHEVMFETLNQKAKWDDWKKNIENVPAECERLGPALTGIVDTKEITSLKQNLLEVAIVVAQAYREIDENSPTIERMKQFIARAISYLQAALGAEQHGHHESMLSISPLERAAIRKLSTLMAVEFKI